MLLEEILRRLEPVDNWVAVNEIFLIHYDKDYYTPIFPNLSSLAATQTAAIPRTEQMSGWCRCSWIIAPLYSLGLRIIRQKQRFALARTCGSSPRQVLHTPEKGSPSSYTTLRSPVYPCCGKNHTVSPQPSPNLHPEHPETLAPLTQNPFPEVPMRFVKGSVERQWRRHRPLLRAEGVSAFMAQCLGFTCWRSRGTGQVNLSRNLL